MINIQKMIPNKEGNYIEIELSDTLSIFDTQKNSNNNIDEQCTSLFLISPIYADKPAIDILNKKILEIRQKYFTEMTKLASSLNIDAFTSASKEAEKQTKQVIIANLVEQFIDSLQVSTPILYSELLSATYTFIKNKIYTADGAQNTKEYDNVKLEQYSENQNLLLLTNDFETLATREYLVFFMNYFVSLSQIKGATK